jgi:hypothetical protein
MACTDNDSFYGYAKGLTDVQLANVLMKEWEAGRQEDYNAARIVAGERGWRVSEGKRVE